MSPAPSTGMRVLIVDDEETIASTLATILRMSGFETRAAFTGTEAIQVAKSFRPDLLIADYKMPGMNGLDTAVEIKKLLPACRVLMLSGHLGEAEYESFRQRGYNFLLLSKPIPPAALLDAIQKNSRALPDTSRPPKVLNVDDVEMHRYSLTRLLKHAGFEVSEAVCGSDAIARAIEQNPEVILLDINLPDMDGFEVCRQLKSDARTAEITVIHITASSTDAASANRSNESGADEFVRHPVDPNELVSHLRSLLQAKYLKEGLQKPRADASDR